jgi:hypothetical protein
MSHFADEFACSDFTDHNLFVAIAFERTQLTALDDKNVFGRLTFAE